MQHFKKAYHIIPVMHQREGESMTTGLADSPRRYYFSNNGRYGLARYNSGEAIRYVFVV